MEDFLHEERVPVEAESGPRSSEHGSRLEVLAEQGVKRAKAFVDEELEALMKEVETMYELARDPEVPESSATAEGQLEALKQQIEQLGAETKQALDAVEGKGESAEPAVEAAEVQEHALEFVRRFDEILNRMQEAKGKKMLAIRDETAVLRTQVQERLGAEPGLQVMDKLLERFQGFVDQRLKGKSKQWGEAPHQDFETQFEAFKLSVIEATEKKRSVMQSKAEAKVEAEAAPPIEEKVQEQAEVTKGGGSESGEPVTAPDPDPEQPQTLKEQSTVISASQETNAGTPLTEVPPTASEPESSPTEQHEIAPSVEDIVRGYADLAAALLKRSGAIDDDLRQRLASLEKQRVDSRRVDEQAWGSHTDAVVGLRDVIDRFSTHPLGLLQALAVQASEHPNFYRDAGISSVEIENAERQIAQEMARDPETCRMVLGSIVSEVFKQRGQITPDIVHRVQAQKEDMQLAREHGGENVNAEEWVVLERAVELIDKIVNESGASVDRLRGLLAFMGDYPEIITHAPGVRKSTLTRELERQLARGAVANEPLPGEVEAAQAKAEAVATEEERKRNGPKAAAAAAVAAAGVGFENGPEAKFVGASQRAIRRMNEDFEAAFQAQNEEEAEGALHVLEKLFKGRTQARQNELNGLLVIHEQDRDELTKARIEELQAAMLIEEKTLERRHLQLDLLRHQREKKAIDAEADAEIAACREKIQQYERDPHFANASESAQMVGLPGMNGTKRELEMRIEEALRKKENVALLIAQKESQVNKLTDLIVVTEQRMSQATEERKRLQMEAEARRVVDAARPEDRQAKEKISRQPTVKVKLPTAAGGAPPAIGGPSLGVEEGIQTIGDVFHSPEEVAAMVVDRIFDPTPKKGKGKSGGIQS